MITTIEEAIDCIDWYRSRVENLSKGNPAPGFAEARAGCFAAIDYLEEVLRDHPSL